MSAYAVVAAAALGGCGSSSSPPTVSTAPAPAVVAPPTTPLPAATTEAATTTTRSVPATTTAGPATTAAPRSDDCEVLGMTRQKLREGPCTHGGIAVYVANRGTLVRLREMSVRLNGYGVRAAGPEQVLAVFSLSVTNNQGVRVAFDARSDEAVLDLGMRSYTEDRKAEDVPGPSFAWQNAGIRPRATQTGSVMFRIPRRLAGRLSRTGSLIVAQPTDAGATTPHQMVAILRIYH